MQIHLSSPLGTSGNTNPHLKPQYLLVKMVRHSWLVVLGSATIVIIISYFDVLKDVIVVRSESPARESSPKTLVGEPVSRCHIPGLASMDQYRAYLHKTETTCSDMVYAYDPTMGKKDHQRSPNVTFFATGIGNYQGTKKVGMGNKWSEQKVDRFENLVSAVGEEGREIDYVKLDVELSEIDFLQDILFNSPHVLAKIKQIAMEVHDGADKGLGQTTTHQVFWPYFMLMRCMGFKLISSRNAGAWREVVWARDF
ncbi:uncharacterized protein LOC126998844 isoform X2 [Eriocheir sinensis]|uniref:uncharacterized protein LOC126998844 isoform X2 n=1 Tax=Eriocheir sinensis TaxID=95602 RepID=UPI0021C9BEB5|nr:uncharacterized protein LOC126998844 isoform X2 [Eriocheir sinensis]